MEFVFSLLGWVLFRLIVRRYMARRMIEGKASVTAMAVVLAALFIAPLLLVVGLSLTRGEIGVGVLLVGLAVVLVASYVLWARFIFGRTLPALRKLVDRR